MAGTSREDWIDAPNPIPDDWQPDGPAQFVDADDVEAIHQKIAEWVTVGLRVGGIFMCSAVREEIAPGLFVTSGFGFKWDSYGGPAQRLPKQDPAPQRRQPAPEPEPVPFVDDTPDMRDLDDLAAYDALDDEQDPPRPAARQEPAAARMSEEARAGEDDPDGIPDDQPRRAGASVLAG